MEKYYRKKKGFSLLELLLGLAIVAALAAAAFIIYPKIVIGQQVKQEANNISQLKTQISALYSSTSSNIPLRTSLNTVVIKAGIAPQTMITGTWNGLKSIWGGDVYVGTYDIANATALAIQYNHVPPEACAKLVMQTARGFEQVVVGAEVSGDANGIVMNGSNRSVIFGINKLGDGETELNIANAVAACSMAKNAFILYKFY